MDATFIELLSTSEPRRGPQEHDILKSSQELFVFLFVSNGKNKKIVQFVKNQKHFSDFFDTINDLFSKMLSGFKDEGKDYITVAFGCTGGVHRSVVSSEMFFLNLKKNKNLEVFIDHRDLKK